MLYVKRNDLTGCVLNAIAPNIFHIST